VLLSLCRLHGSPALKIANIATCPWQVMSRDLFDYLVREKIADGPLISKWRKPGYEILCSMLAIQKVGNSGFQGFGL